MYKEKISFDYIYDIVEDNKEALTSLLKILHRNLGEFPQKIREALENQDYLTLRETAHKFKSCTAYTGLNRFNQTLTNIEKSEEMNLPANKIEEMVAFIEKASVPLSKQVEAAINDLA